MPRRRSARFLLLTVVILGLSLGGAAFLWRGITAIEESLPLRSLHLERDFSSLLLDVRRLDTALRLAEALGGSAACADLEHALDLVFLRLADNKALYAAAAPPELTRLQGALDSQLGALDAIVALPDCGLAGLPDHIPAVVRLSGELRAYSDEIFQTSMEKASAQRLHLQDLRIAVTASVALFALLGLGLTAMLFRQNRQSEALEQRDRLLLAGAEIQRELRERLEKIADNVPGMIFQFRLDPDGNARFLYANRGVAEIFGVSPDAARQDAGAVFAAVHPDDLRRVWRAVRASGRSMGLWRAEFRALHPLRGVIWAEGAATPEREPGGAVVWHGNVREITERKRSEHALVEQASELARSNEELEAFAYAASHDLRQPLRSIISYLTLLEGELKGKLDEDGREFLGFARDGAKRMDRLIVDLLEYSRVGRRTTALKECPLAEVVDIALQNLRAAIAEAGATVTVDCGLPVVAGDFNELVRLFQNLLGNAVKYRAADRAPVVRLSCRGEDGAWRVAVADNGIGIPEEHRDRVFGIFQRLHSRDRYEGTGIGLAVCKKIVEHHQGRIWVESTPGRGSVFHVSLPLTVTV